MKAMPLLRVCSSSCAVAVAAFVVCTMAMAARSQTDSAVPTLLPTLGKTIHYRITRLAQGNTGPRTALSEVTLHRKSATSLTLRGLYDRPSTTNVLAVGMDGSLRQAGEKAESDASLTDVVNGLNRVGQIFAGRNSIPHDGWSAKLALPDVSGATAPVVIPIAVENLGPAVELHGVGQLTLEPPAAAADLGPRDPRSRFRLLGQPGGGSFADRGSVGSSAARQAVSIAVSVDGRLRKGTLSKISIVETRSTTFDTLPYVNVSGWTIEAVK